MQLRSTPKIGVGITTHNRYDTFKKSYEEIIKRTPNAKIVVVDDASAIPVKEASYRFNNNVGIARAKNKCLDLLDDCEHIFLFDDDTYPLVDEWYKPYIECSEPHLMYIFKDFATNIKLNDTIKLYQDSEKVAYSHARGCMLYFDRICLDKVGGMNPLFGKWGWEHPNLSERIYNCGLTSFRYMDVVNSKGLIYSADEHQKATSTVKGIERTKQISINRPIYESMKDSKEFIPYKDGKNVVITCYFTNAIDPQRNVKWTPNYDDLKVLIDSVVSNNQRLIILHDCFNMPDTELVKHIKVDTSLTPYWQRWVSIQDYLRKHPEIGKVWCVDGTDVEMLKNPFEEMEYYLYTGDENEKIGCVWMRKNHPAQYIQAFITKNADNQLLNAGLLGGTREQVLEFIHHLLKLYFDNVNDVAYKKSLSVGESDMGLFNYVASQLKIKHGAKVNTEFKKFQKNNFSWWRHK